MAHSSLTMARAISPSRVCRQSHVAWAWAMGPLERPLRISAATRSARSSGDAGADAGSAGESGESGMMSSSGSVRSPCAPAVSARRQRADPPPRIVCAKVEALGDEDLDWDDDQGLAVEIALELLDAALDPALVDEAAERLGEAGVGGIDEDGANRGEDLVRGLRRDRGVVLAGLVTDQPAGAQRRGRLLAGDLGHRLVGLGLAERRLGREIV